MPIFEQDELLAGTSAGELEAVGEEVSPVATSTFNETLEASFKLDNTVFNIVKETMDRDADTSATNPDFDPFEGDGRKLQGYEQYADRFIGANSDKDIAIIKADVDHELEQRDIISKAPGWSQVTSGILANTIDPLALIPVVKTLSYGTKAGRVAQGALQGTAFGAAGGLSREATLQSIQETRSAGESMISILTESAFGGILGGATGALSATQRASSRMVLSKALQGEDYKMNIREDGTPYVARSAGAAQTITDLEAEGLAHINENLAKAIGGAGIEGLKSPTLRGVTSRFGVTRQLTNKLFQHNFILGKETQGIARGRVAENSIRQDDAKLIQLNSAVNKLYLEHTGKGSILSSSSLTRPEGKVSFGEFNERIARVLRDETLEDSLPQVNKAAKLYRAELDRLAKEMQELKILPEDLDPKTARNYLTRIYDTRKLNDRAVRDRFISKVKEHYKLKEADGTLREVPLDDDVAESLALDTLDNIMREGDNALTFNSVPEQVISTGKFDKSRSLLIPDNELEEFLVNDAQQVVTNYSRRASSIINVQKSLNDLGYESFSDFRQALKAEKDTQLAALTDTKARQKLQDDFARDMQLTEDMYRLMTGTLRKPQAGDRYVNSLLQFQFVRLLGGVTLSSIPELAMAPFRQGLLNTFRDGYLPMLRDFKAAKLAKDQLADLDIGLEHEMNNVLRALADTNVDLGRRQTEYDRYLGMVTDAFGKASGLSYYTAFGRRLGAHVSMSNIVRTLRKSRSTQLTPKEIERLANSGISSTEYEKILKQIDKYAEERGGSFISNHHLWRDQDAADIFRRAVQNETESIVLKPSKGDIPLFAQRTGLGRLLFQFKSFSSAATNKIAISSLQRRDARTLAGLMYLTSLGTISAMVKDKLAGRETSTDPIELIGEGISRSGIAGLLATVPIDMSLTLYNQKSRRYGGKYLLGQVIGPTFGMTQDIGDMLGRLTDGDMSESDKKAALRLLPFMNLFYIRYLTDKAFNDSK